MSKSSSTREDGPPGKFRQKAPLSVQNPSRDFSTFLNAKTLIGEFEQKADDLQKISRMPCGADGRPTALESLFHQIGE
jgi:hypothetical protein